MSIRHKQTGVTIVELMVGVAVGMLVIAMVISVYMVVSRGGKETLNSAKLNQELRGSMDIMVADIRRAGYWARNATGPNPFTERGTPTRDISIHEDGTCIVFTYDATYNSSSTAGSVESVDFFGFRKNGNVIEMLDGATAGITSTAACPSHGWQALTDSHTVKVTSLSFSTMGSKCLNSTPEPDVAWTVNNPASTTPACLDSSASGYVAPSAGDRLAESRQIVINLEGEHAKDSRVKLRLRQAVRLRNDRAFVVP